MSINIMLLFNETVWCLLLACLILYCMQNEWLWIGSNKPIYLLVLVCPSFELILHWFLSCHIKSSVILSHGNWVYHLLPSAQLVFNLLLLIKYHNNIHNYSYNYGSLGRTFQFLFTMEFTIFTTLRCTHVITAVISM